MISFRRASLTAIVMIASWSRGELAFPQCYEFESEVLMASDPQVSDDFGWAVCLEQDLAVISAPWADGPSKFDGALYVFRRQGEVWKEEQKLFSSYLGARLGFWTATNGDSILARALTNVPVGGLNSVYVFRFDGVQWTETQRLMPRGANLNGNFGADLKMDGDVAVIGAVGIDDRGPGAGAAYIYRFQGGSWVEEAKLLAAVGSANDLFGSGVAIDGDVAAVCSYSSFGLASGKGAVHVFRRVAGTWTEEALLRPTNTSGMVAFGEGLAVDGNRIAATLRAINGTAVVTFQKVGAAWQQEQEIVQAGLIGGGLELEGDTLAVGAPLLGPLGTVFVFRHRGGLWIEQQRFHTSVTHARQGEIGRGLALDGGRLLAGDPEARLQGEAYLFDIPDLSLDADSTVVNPLDDLTLSSCGGLPFDSVMIAAIDEGGRPTFLKVAPVGTYPVDGLYSVTLPIAPGLSGLAVTFQSFGFIDAGMVAPSNTRVVTFL